MFFYFLVLLSVLAIDKGGAEGGSRSKINYCFEHKVFLRRMRPAPLKNGGRGIKSSFGWDDCGPRVEKELTFSILYELFP